MKAVFPELVGEIAKRGIKKSAIVKQLGISERAFYNKLYGTSSFTWNEVCTIIDCFFPDLDAKTLFARAEPERKGV